MKEYLLHAAAPFAVKVIQLNAIYLFLLENEVCFQQCMNCIEIFL
jgi:hypothetical protein